MGSARPQPLGAATGLAEEAIEHDVRLEDCWRDCVAGLNAKKRMLGAFLEESRFVGLAGDRLLLAMDDLHRAVVEEGENRALIAAEVRRAFGRGLDLRCVPPQGASPAVRPPALQDVRPLVDQAIAWFEGETIERKATRTERPRE